MKRVNKGLTTALLLASVLAQAQMAHYNYKRELTGITGQWHSFVLPSEVFGKSNSALTDLRIYGITPNNDTIEVPYLLRLKTEQRVGRTIAFKTINTSKNSAGHYFTFEVPTLEAINQINLSFAQRNFDWHLRLEASHDQKTWFTLIENYRILSIVNASTNFQFTKLTFPDSKFRFYRIQVLSQEQPDLLQADISEQAADEARYISHPTKKFRVTELRESKRTEVDFELNTTVPVSYLHLAVSSTIDYYRPIVIKHLTDSTKTPNGWVYNYTSVATGILTSIDPSPIIFNSKTAQKWKVVIENDDNLPLAIASAQVKGYEHQLIARFDAAATYFLVYGNPQATWPQYDIARFADKLPSAPKPLSVGPEVALPRPNTEAKQPMFANPAWLWAIMGVMMAVMGWFSVKMLRG